ncbi:MAG: hypothetical protein IPJ03_16210 [Ignavibacteriales bacterium]|nr:hypothetical protein [Ignavibacteriales bacterium]MBK7380499.1 hypothetical protein [Ignavibacteriales bacterium]
MKETHPYDPDWEILELCYEPKHFYCYHLVVRSLDSDKTYFWAVADLSNWRYTFDKCKVHTSESFNRNFFNPFNKNEALRWTN